MDDNNDKNFEVFPFEGAKYKTQLTKKFSERKKWEPDNPYIVGAVIPGTVLKIAVKEGQKVSQGRMLYVLEAMKMKNKILSNVNGVIKKISVEEGQKVAKNELIMEIEPPASKESKGSSRRRRK